MRNWGSLWGESSRNMGAILRKELRSYFTSPLAYAVTAVFLVISGFIFALNVINAANQGFDVSMRGVHGAFAFLLLFFGPLLTMRLLAEEQASGTVELLLTAPVRDYEVVLGKFLASVALLGVVLLLTLYFPLLLYLFSLPDTGPMVTGYLGVFLVGLAFMAVGLLTSSFTRHQIVAAVVGIGILLILWVIEGAAQYVPDLLKEPLRYLAPARHVEDFTKGVIDARDVVFFISFVLIFLFLTVRSLETRRWR